jgi:hypothetical protein
MSLRTQAQQKFLQRVQHQWKLTTAGRRFHLRLSDKGLGLLLKQQLPCRFYPD